jgi:hypothetical protein
LLPKVDTSTNANSFVFNKLTTSLQKVQLPGVQAAALDLPELRLPLARQLRALEPAVADQGDQVPARVGGDQCLLPPRDVAPRGASR